MTRALKTQNILKSLLKGLTIAARSDKYIHSSGNASNECSSNLHEEDIKHDSFYAPTSTSLNTVSTIDLQKPIDIAHEENTVSNSWTTNHNSSLLGPRTMQWVHVVCGLWTPGTKCPNATTMSAFDLSGASPAKRNTVSSLNTYSYDDLSEQSFSTCKLKAPPMPNASLGHEFLLMFSYEVTQKYLYVL